MKMVVLDGYSLNPGDLSWAELEQFGELEVYDRTGYDDNCQSLVIQRGAGATVLMTNKTPIREEAMDSLPDLKFISVLATGYNIVDVEAARKRGIVVSNIPTYGTASVAQMTIALMLELCHHVGAHSEAVMKGEWSSNPDWSFWKYPLVELDEKKLGIIGFGRIGQATARVANALGMKVLVYNPRRKEAQGLMDVDFVSLERVFRDSDFISLHCPLLPETKGIINRGSISLMKEGVRIINTSRGPLIIEQDLAEALGSGKVAGAALDVVSAEPIKPENPLLKAPNCLITPHISWAPLEARKRLMKYTAENIRQYVNGTPIHVV